VIELQVTACAFGSLYALRLTAEGLTEVFCTTYRFGVTRLWSDPRYVRNFDDADNTVARRFSPYANKYRYTVFSTNIMTP